MSFGGDTIVFKHLMKTGTFDDQGNAVMTTVNTSAPGSRHRPLTMFENAELGFDVADQRWRSTIPLFEYDEDVVAVLSSAKPQDVIAVDGIDYQIIGGVRPHKDMAGKPFKMTIISKIHVG